MQSFRIATFNVENLLHPGVSFAGRGSEMYSDALYEDKISWIGRILDEGSPDIVGFQELSSRRSIDDALGRSQHLCSARIVAPGLDDNIHGDRARGPFVGLATRFPILESERIVQFPQAVIDGLIVEGEASPMSVRLPISKFQRPVLRVKLSLRENITATVFVAHLKSKRGQLIDGESSSDPLAKALGSTRSLILRAAESVALRALSLDASRLVSELDAAPLSARSDHGIPVTEIAWRSDS